MRFGKQYGLLFDKGLAIIMPRHKEICKWVQTLDYNPKSLIMLFLGLSSLRFLLILKTANADQRFPSKISERVLRASRLFYTRSGLFLA